MINVLGLKIKIVMYSGNLGRYQPLEVMIDTANELRGRRMFVFICREWRKEGKDSKYG